MRALPDFLLTLRFLPMAALAVVITGALDAAPVTVGSPPGGYYALHLKGGSDNYVALPLLRPAVATGEITGVQPNRVVVAGAGWASGVYAKNDAAPQGAWYAEFLSGPLKGVFYQILTNSEDTLVLDTEGDDLTAHPAGALGFGDIVRIRPAWTVGGVFGVNDATIVLDPQLSPLSQADSVLLMNNETTGINKAPNQELAYVQGVGWRRAGNSSLDVTGQPLAVGEPIVVRRRAAQDLTLLVVGAPVTEETKVYVPGGDGASANDAYTTLLHTEPVSLNDSGLHNPADPTGSVIRDSLSSLAPTDLLLGWSEGTGFNLAPDQVFYFLRNQGWRQVGSSSTTVGADYLLQPGRAYVVRKDKAHPGVDWPQTPQP